MLQWFGKRGAWSSSSSLRVLDQNPRSSAVFQPGAVKTRIELHFGVRSPTEMPGSRLKSVRLWKYPRWRPRQTFTFAIWPHKRGIFKMNPEVNPKGGNCFRSLDIFVAASFAVTWPCSIFVVILEWAFSFFFRSTLLERHLFGRSEARSMLFLGIN